MDKSKVFITIVFGAYAVVSKLLFDTVYLTSNLVVDEEFHLPLGEQYCRFNFKVWDSKVTTLPGLYLVTSALLGPFGLCSIYWLRAVSLIFASLNFFLFYVLFRKANRGNWQNVFSALSLSLLPPLYFCAHIYYTDVVSLSSVLLLIILNENGQHYFASIAGFFSIVCRQTNVIFVAIYGGNYVLTALHKIWEQKKFKKSTGKFPIQNLKPLIIDVLTNPISILKHASLEFWLNSLSYISILGSFILFVYLNGGIVVGDRSAHPLSINIPQLFYFSLFCLIFGWPHFVGEVLNFLKFAVRHKIFMLIFALTTVLVIHFNTEVHPYLLADNRHLTFYVWSRFYGKFWWFRYAMTPIYIFALYVIVKILWDKKDTGFFVLYSIGVTVLLVSQNLLEDRYFLVPYVIMRLRMKNQVSTVFNVALEFVTYCIINMITFNIFFTKVLYWTDTDYPQRIIW